MMKANIGMIGLAVMGVNLALNIESKGFCVAVYNYTPDEIDAFMDGPAMGKNVVGCYTLKDFVSAIERPRRIMMMVRAGAPVDSLIDQLIPLLDPGDVIIDGGNSHFPDTARRLAVVESHGLLYVGTGVSGGEEGALKGPSMMPGGSPAAWPLVKDVFQAICAKVDGVPCCDWVGEGGAGHFVKMVHNGIEYGDMQLICEAYQLMRDGLGMTADEMSKVFDEWNAGELGSYLIEITADILRKKDRDGAPIVDKILDAAGQKGTGKWTGVAALDSGVPLTLIAEAVFARCLSALKDERIRAGDMISGPGRSMDVDRSGLLSDLRSALYAAKIVSYAQGYQLMRAAAHEYGWNLNYGGIALMWRGGCIIRSKFLGKIKDAFGNAPDLTNLMLDPYFKSALEGAQSGLRRVVANAALSGIPVPSMSAALAYFDGYRCANLPANLLQAQRDYFGAHKYERTDAERGTFFHTNWTGEGGDTASGTYTV